MRMLEARRVQKLGASSLIVTIPKDWARKLNIEPGQIVYLSKEGDTIRIIPQSKARKEKMTPILEIESEKDLLLARQAVNCIYVTGLDKAIIKSKKKTDKLSLEVKRRALDLMGVEVYEEDDRTLQIMIYIDIQKTDINSILKQVSHSALKALDTIKVLLGDERNKSFIVDETQILKKDLVRYQHAILRYLSTERTREPSSILYYMASAVGYFSSIIDILLSYTDLVVTMDLDEQAKLSDQSRKIIESLKKLVTETVSLLLEPNNEKLDKVLKELEKLENNIRSRIKEDTLTRAETIFLSQVLIIARIFKTIIYVVTCEVVLSIMKNLDLE
ncbi:MAG: AbrB/MazE/SpoVT family DNA-binding domain-containing protein [Desulfurococcales archaeon]|nr:AbrB/MazE/SpoVT family DNA-binding domain-containing protein [Desulfurococcales archaeon]